MRVSIALLECGHGQKDPTHIPSHHREYCYECYAYRKVIKYVTLRWKK